MRPVLVASVLLAMNVLAFACGGSETSGPSTTAASPDADTATEGDDASRAPRPMREAGPMPDANELEAGSCPDDVGDPEVMPVLDGPLPAFVASYGPSSRNAAHGGDGNPAGDKCFPCHNPGGKGRAFFFAGTVNGGAPVPMQVLVREAYGRVLATQVDRDGNFFFDMAKAPACTSVPLRAAVRTATATRAMPDQQRGSSCNGCHAGVTPP